MRSDLIAVQGLRVSMPSKHGNVAVVDGVDYSVGAGEIFGIAGESGSGKTVGALALMRLLPEGATVNGRVIFGGQDLLALPRRALRRMRGAEIAMVFQDPLTSLHPMLPIEKQMTEHLRAHERQTARTARRRAAELLDEVRIPDPERALRAYPHEFSGGMRQRIAIASALICRPRLLIADEPTTALDVTVQAGILHLLDDLRRERGLTVILITHDLGVLSAIADRVSVFYCGRIVESGPSEDVLAKPLHPYTRALIDALPGRERSGHRGGELRSIDGTPPTPRSRPLGCSFHPRCRFANESCRRDVPSLLPTSRGRLLACPPNPFALR
jgi:oligopeptide transport system ATP-binding protein